MHRYNIHRFFVPILGRIYDHYLQSILIARYPIKTSIKQLRDHYVYIDNSNKKYFRFRFQ